MMDEGEVRAEGYEKGALSSEEAARSSVGKEDCDLALEGDEELAVCTYTTLLSIHLGSSQGL
jgi:hypothetical protein